MHIFSEVQKLVVCYRQFRKEVSTCLHIYIYIIVGLTASTLLHQLVILSVCFIYPMSGPYSTNWDRKRWPGSKVQMYYSCQWLSYLHQTIYIRNLQGVSKLQNLKFVYRNSRMCSTPISVPNIISRIDMHPIILKIPYTNTIITWLQNCMVLQKPI